VTLALTTIIAVIYTWRTANRVGARVLAGTRVISVLLTAPIFFSQGLTESGRVYAALPIMPVPAAYVLVAILTVTLVLSRPAPVRA
jgi:hypothetical protein